MLQGPGLGPSPPLPWGGVPPPCGCGVGLGWGWDGEVGPLHSRISKSLLDVVTTGAVQDMASMESNDLVMKFAPQLQ